MWRGFFWWPRDWVSAFCWWYDPICLIWSWSPAFTGTVLAECECDEDWWLQMWDHSFEFKKDSAPSSGPRKCPASTGGIVSNWGAICSGSSDVGIWLGCLQDGSLLKFSGLFCNDRIPRGSGELFYSTDLGILLDELDLNRWLWEKIKLPHKSAKSSNSPKMMAVLRYNSC